MKLINMCNSNSTRMQFPFEGQLNVNVSIISYLVQWLLFFPTVYVNVLVIQMVKHESLSISLELTWISSTYVISSIFSLVYVGMIKFAFPVSFLIGDWFCQTANVFMSALMVQELVATFTVSLYRYVFIMYREKYATSEKIQKRVTRIIFLSTRFGILLMSAKYIIFNHKYLYVKFWTSVCNGDVLKYTADEIYNSTEIESSKNIIYEYIEKLSYRGTEDNTALFTIFGTVENPALVRFLQLFCVVIDVMIFLTLMNWTEGIMYYRIANFWKGYVY